MKKFIYILSIFLILGCSEDDEPNIVSTLEESPFLVSSIQINSQFDSNISFTYNDSDQLISVETQSGLYSLNYNNGLLTSAEVDYFLVDNYSKAWEFRYNDNGHLIEYDDISLGESPYKGTFVISYNRGKMNRVAEKISNQIGKIYEFNTDSDLSKYYTIGLSMNYLEFETSFGENRNPFSLFDEPTRLCLNLMISNLFTEVHLQDFLFLSDHLPFEIKDYDFGTDNFEEFIVNFELEENNLVSSATTAGGNVSFEYIEKN